MISLLRRKHKSVDLRWVDGFVRNIRPHIFVRERDRLLILMPNQAYRLNETALFLLKSTMSGRPILRVVDDMLSKSMQTEDALLDVQHFFWDLRSLVMGCLCEGHGRRSIEQVSFRREESVLPVLSEIAVTYRCNLSCKFCYAGCTCTRKPDCDEMSLDEVKTVLQKIRTEAEVPSVSFTGGEPTIREDLCEMVRFASDIGLRVNLITNGVLMNKRLAQGLKKAGLRSAQVSVEGPDAALHDAITTIPGSFEATVRGIGLLKEQGVYVHTNTTINRLNADHLEGIADLAKSLGLPRFSMNMVMPCGSAQPGETVLRYSDVGSLVQKVKRRAKIIGIEFMWYSPTPYCIFNPISEGLGSKACAACDGLLSVAPDGDVLPCSSLMDPVGSLLHEDFEAVWNSTRARYYRSRSHAPDTCQSCGQFEICSGACPIYWDAFGHSELHSITCAEGNVHV